MFNRVVNTYLFSTIHLNDNQTRKVPGFMPATKLLVEYSGNIKMPNNNQFK